MSELKREARTPRGNLGRVTLLWLGASFAVVFGLAALAIPALISGSLIMRGVCEGHPSWIVLGGVAGGMWSMMLLGTIRRAGVSRGDARPARSDAPPGSDPAPD